MRPSLLLTLSLLLVTPAALAEGKPARRAELRPVSAQVVRMTVRGRDARPHVITEIQRAQVRFGVGTTAYAWPGSRQLPARR